MKLDPLTGKKICGRCREEKTIDDYTADKYAFDGLCCYCRDCERQRSAQYYEQHQVRRREYSRAYNEQHREERSEWKLAFHRDNPTVVMWRSCRYRARTESLPFTISAEDIEIPDDCPLCGRKLVLGVGEGRGGKKLSSPSVDRYDPKLGYVLENIWVICNHCNARKQDMSGEDHVIFGRKLIDAFSLTRSKVKSE
jgi:hypothetical protein